LSAKAGPAKATTAPSANVASMVLVFGMIFSLLLSASASKLGVSIKTMGFRFYSRDGVERFKFSGSARLE
jgi:hypothetical protein